MENRAVKIIYIPRSSHFPSAQKTAHKSRTERNEKKCCSDGTCAAAAASGGGSGAAVRTDAAAAAQSGAGESIDRRLVRYSHGPSAQAACCPRGGGTLVVRSTPGPQLPRTQRYIPCRRSPLGRPPAHPPHARRPLEGCTPPGAASGAAARRRGGGRPAAAACVCRPTGCQLPAPLSPPN
jgi:hypothetical protein